MKKKLLFTISIIIYAVSAYAQQTSVSNLNGRVLSDKTQMPLPGSSIMLRSGHTSTVTDEQGNFNLELRLPADTLIVSHVGYATQYIPVSGKQSKKFVVRLTPTTSQLQEIMVSTGYQEIPKERATGSFDFIDNKTLNEQVGTGILNRIKGVASSVLFDTKNSQQRKYNFTIRGLSTINGPKDPLIIVDNFPYEGDINNINPNDIENITVLKDAAAASVWGARAGNGVIVITTKKGKFNEPLNVRFNADVIIKQRPDLFKLPQMSSGNYIDVEKYLFDKGFYDATLSNPSFPAVSPVVDLLDQQRRGLITADQANEQINALRGVDIRKELDRFCYQDAVTQQYSLALSGGSQKAAYMISGDYDKEINELAAPDSRLNLRIENTYKPFNRLRLTTGLIYTNSESKNGKPGYGSFHIGGKPIPYVRLADESGIPLSIPATYRSEYTDTAGQGKLLDWNYYPLEDYKYMHAAYNTQDILFNAGLLYEMIKGLSLDIKYQYERQQIANKQTYDIGSYYVRDLINTYTQIDPVTGDVTRAVPLGGIMQLSNATLVVNNVRGQLNYSHSWKQGQLIAVAGGEISDRHGNSYGDLAYGYDKDNLNFDSNLDFENSHPTFITGWPIPIPNGFSLGENRNRFVSLYANGAFTLKDRYGVSASMRKDASNIFGLNTNDKWQPLWSAGLSWTISKESFYSVKFFPSLRFRLTYGYSGNVDPSKSAVTLLRYGDLDPNSNLQTALISQLNNPDLRWEKSGMFNAGIDFSSLRNKISGSLEYYHKKGTDLYGPSPIDYTAGTVQSSDVITKNIADMSGDGIDVKINSINIDRLFKWKTRLILSMNESKTTNYYISSATTPGYFVGNGNEINPIVGKPLYSMISFKWGGLDPANGNPRGYDADGKLSDDYLDIYYAEGDLKSLHNIVYSGSASPEYFGSVSNSFSWKNFSLIVNIGYELGYYFRKPALSYSTLFQVGSGNADFAKRWQKPGDETRTNVPSMIYPANSYRDQLYILSEATVLKGDNVRLHYINLEYSLSQSFCHKLSLRSGAIYVNAANLGILWKANKEGMDPDYPGSIPLSKTCAVGIKINF